MSILVPFPSPAGGGFAPPPRIPLDDDADLWARTRLLARTIPRDADLSDLDDVVRALFAQHFSWADIADCLEDAIDLARKERDHYV